MLKEYLKFIVKEILPAVALTKTHFSSLADFKRVLEKPEKIKRCAVRKCVEEEIDRLKEALKGVEVPEMEEEIYRVVEKAVRILKSDSAPEIFLVERFPEPFSKMKWTFAWFSWLTEKKYGIKKGIYIRKDMYIPLFHASLVAHEVVHFFIAENSYGQEAYKKPFTIEEGVCDVISFFIALKMYGKEHVRNVAEVLYFSRNSSKLFQIYNHFTLLAYFNYYKKLGIRGLVEVCRRGWKGISEIDKIEIRRKGRCKELEDALDYVFSVSPSNTCSAEAFLVARAVEEGASIDDIARKCGLGREEVKGALDELMRKVDVLRFDGKRVRSVNEERVKRLRYEIR